MDNAGGDHPPDRFKPLDGGDRLVIVNGKPASRRRLQIAIPMMPVPIQPTRRTACPTLVQSWITNASEGGRRVSRDQPCERAAGDLRSVISVVR